VFCLLLIYGDFFWIQFEEVKLCYVFSFFFVFSMFVCMYIVYQSSFPFLLMYRASFSFVDKIVYGCIFLTNAFSKYNAFKATNLNKMYGVEYDCVRGWVRLCTGWIPMCGELYRSATQKEIFIFFFDFFLFRILPYTFLFLLFFLRPKHTHTMRDSWHHGAWFEKSYKLSLTLFVFKGKLGFLPPHFLFRYA